MATSGYYDEISKIEQLRTEQVERLQKKLKRNGLVRELASRNAPVNRLLVRKLPGRRSWDH
jgi:hypothetical protein